MINENEKSPVAELPETEFVLGPHAFSSEGWKNINSDNDVIAVLDTDHESILRPNPAANALTAAALEKMTRTHGGVLGNNWNDNIKQIYGDLLK